MALVINTNLGSINGQRNLNSSGTALSTAMNRLSSGVRVNNAKDDAAGLAIADRMNSQVRGMTVAVRNANDGISLTQTAEGALGSLTDTLQRMRDLAVQSSSNAGVSASDRDKMNTEFKALNEELIRVVQNSEFNGKKILNGDLAGGLNIQVGATTDTNSRISVAVSNMATLLTPVTKATLSPAYQPIDSTLASTVANNANTAALDPTLAAANAAAKLANAAVVAAAAAQASPTDLALAKAASLANVAAAAAVAGSSAVTKTTTDANGPAGTALLSQAFVDGVTAASSSDTAASAAIAVTDATMQVATVTDTSQAASLLTTAKQLASAASANVAASGQNVYVTTMNAMDGDTLNVPASALDATGQLVVSNTLNDAVNRAQKVGNAFGADREAQKTLAGLQIAKAIAAASYVNNPLATATANDTDKASFVANNKLVVSVSTAADAVAADYALSAMNHIDKAIASIDTERSNLGSTQNRFTTTISNLQNGIENQSAAKSRILDADFATETANLSRAQILQQAGTAMLAQANQSGQSVMTLLR
ncbi:MAG: flagellin [Methylococcales bacterium]|nr:flagellin [Methylococcales bacterium]MDD5755111.1 flagellin [Methylococcales bacterium]